MLQKIVDFFILLDKKVTMLILAFLQNYELQTVQRDFVFTIPMFIKLTFYCLIFLIPFLILKLLYPFKRQFHFLLMFILFLIVMSLFGVFIGFVQLLYS